jgi:hypothetical protein
MKEIKTTLALCVLVLSSSCSSMSADYIERLKGVQKVCPTCNFVTSENRFYAVDTSKRPNIIYMVHFKFGGLLYKASDVDHLVRIN